MIEDLLNFVNNKSLKNVIEIYPIATDFLVNFRLDNIRVDVTLKEALEEIEEENLNEFGLDKQGFIMNFCIFLNTLANKEEMVNTVTSITILGGYNKLNEREDIELNISQGEIISIVGPTGAGKSRLLGDIECLAQGDTPTGRKILVNNVEVDEIKRFELDGKLVAQLSQNMNFVMDLTVHEFLEMHAKSRLTPNAEEVIEKCFKCANDLAGEKFNQNTKVTQLSGGQSRAIMIADTAYISESPIVLIDEIENAGIDRRKAIELLAKKEKIVLVSTHDPLLAISADKRIIIKNGGIHKVIETSLVERKSLLAIEKLDDTFMMLRNRLRSGEIITEEIIKY